MKSSNLRHYKAGSQNKGLREYQRRASQLWTGPSPTRDREAGRKSQSRKGANLDPETASSAKLPAGSQLLIRTSWDSGWLTFTGRVVARDQLPKRDTWHT